MSATGGGPAAGPGTSWAERVYDRLFNRFAALRRRWDWFDHLAHAGGRYSRVQGDLLAAGITYFAFLSMFPILLLIASVVGLVLAGNTLLQEQLVDAIRETFPGETGDFIVDQVQSAISSSGFVGVIGLLGFIYAGLRTMDKLRIGVRRMWTGRPVEPDFLQDNLRDVVAFAALGVVGLLSVALTGIATAATDLLLDWLGVNEVPGYFLLTTVVGLTLALAGDTAIFLWLLKVVPHTPVAVRLLMPGALLGAVGFEILKVLGGVYLALISGSVTASTFGGAVGILVWINLVSRFALFTTSWTATLPRVLPTIRADVPDPVAARDAGPS